MLKSADPSLLFKINLICLGSESGACALPTKVRHLSECWEENLRRCTLSLIIEIPFFALGADLDLLGVLLALFDRSEIIKVNNYQ